MSEEISSLIFKSRNNFFRHSIYKPKVIRGDTMEKIKKGDIVARYSHKCDIMFFVQNIIRNLDGIEIAILKGITIRIVADAYLNDLVILDNKKVNENLRSLDIKIEDRIKKEEYKYKERNVYNIKYGKILHLDGDCIIL